MGFENNYNGTTFHHNFCVKTGIYQMFERIFVLFTGTRNLQRFSIIIYYCCCNYFLHNSVFFSHYFMNISVWKSIFLHIVWKKYFPHFWNTIVIPHLSTGKQVIHTRIFFSHGKFGKLYEQNIIFLLIFRWGMKSLRSNLRTRLIC